MILDEFVEHLRRDIGDQPKAEYARRLGVSAVYLGDVLAGRRLPGKKLLDAVGYKKIIEYVEVGHDHH